MKWSRCYYYCSFSIEVYSASQEHEWFPYIPQLSWDRDGFSPKQGAFWICTTWLWWKWYSGFIQVKTSSCLALALLMAHSQKEYLLFFNLNYITISYPKLSTCDAFENHYRPFYFKHKTVIYSSTFITVNSFIVWWNFIEKPNYISREHKMLSGKDLEDNLTSPS